MVETMLDGERRDRGFLPIRSEQRPANGIHALVLDELERRQLLFLKESRSSVRRLVPAAFPGESEGIAPDRSENMFRAAFAQGVYQIGEVYARSVVVSGASSGSSVP
jgi:hypothetical protein